MSIKKLDDDLYEVDIRLGGRDGKRIRRRFEKKGEAVAFERYTLANVSKKEWQSGAGIERRKLSEILELWWLYHGQNLKNGIIERRQLNKTVIQFGDPEINRLNKRVILEHRTQRLIGGISAATINRDIYRISGLFSALIKVEVLDCPNPFKGLPPLAEKQPAMTFLSKPEIKKLLEVLSGDALRLALLCLSTGARWGEASSLRAEQVANGRVTFLDTKNGKNRMIPISVELEQEIRKQDFGGLFKVDYEAFCNTLRLVKPALPKGQASHVLRHTFASHFMMNGGNIVALQQILGHASIQQTMAYAHLAPDYLKNAVNLNPLHGKLSI
ncbi:phage integrase [Acerihabitans arboris]|uniref:Tyrosine-type recombinase/integrase n=1 Tax=Acerihabitans arboris TaxID=2691583 RepID=A0A845SNN0_9GAMM|nr:tyrosine-type recombinase/integrase [Acerihabitans arboris]NDL64807.1 tyrosine-type recombinase/integrase [Acerihabitans arboris]